MKKLLLLFLFTVISVITKAQLLPSIPVNVYVINPNGCPYTITSTWTNPLFGAGNGTFQSVDSLSGQEVWHLMVPDTASQTLFTVCAVLAPPCNCPVTCAGPMPIYPNISITLALCQNMGIEMIETTKQKEVVRVIDLLGKESELVANKILIIQYNDGTTEKVFIRE